MRDWLARALALWSLTLFVQAEEPPARVVTHYCLVSSLGMDVHDPSAWRLLGSSDGGETWTVLDARTNRQFIARCQRLTCRVAHPAPYNTYRLQIDAVHSSDLGPDASVQLADLHLIGPFLNVASETNLQPVITSSCPHPLFGSPENAFDCDPATKWVDYGVGSSNGCWIQIRYAFDSKKEVTNISQVHRLTHLSADRQWLAERGPHLLAALADPSASRPKLLGYALTAANDEPDRDPHDWALLGSDDGGKTWVELDKRVNQTFTERFQRRVFQLTNAAAYRLYRLQIEATAVEGAYAQLGEVEPLYAGAETNMDYSLVVGANTDNPPLESAEMAFDGDPKSKWLSASVVPDQPACLQWQRVPREASMPVISGRELDGLDRSLRVRKALESTNIPVVAINGYALTSANDFPARDPCDWRLEGSSDGGATWETLDARRHEQFPQRMQRREFTLARPAARQWFRFQIDLVNDPAKANSVQLGGLELRFKDAASGQLTALVRCQGENAPAEIIDNLFDNDPKSKWLDYADGVSNRSSWIEWRYAEGKGEAAINLDREEFTQSLRPRRTEARLNAVVVYTDARMNIAGLVDETGFQRFQLAPWPNSLEAGQQVKLSGDLQTTNGSLVISEAKVDALKPLPSYDWERPDTAYGTGEVFASATVAGKVEGVFSGTQYSGARIRRSDGSSLVVRVTGSAFPRLPFLDCSVLARGVVERLLDEKRVMKPAVLWVANADAITFVPKPSPAARAMAGASNMAPLLTRIADVREFSASSTNQNAPAKLQGVLTYIDLNLGDFYLQNGADGIVINGQLNAGLSSLLAQEGNWVEVEAIAQPGSTLATSFARVLGKGSFPEPARPSWAHLMTGENDARWVEVEGVVTSVEKHRLTLNVSGGQLIVWVNEMDNNSFHSLAGSFVRIQGVCSPVVNARNQRLGVRLLLPSSEFVEVLNPARENPFNAPSVPIAAVMSADYKTGGLPAQCVKTVGVVTCRQPRLLFIQNGADGLRVALREEADVAPGDLVEAVGWPQPDGFSPKLTQAVVRHTGRGKMPAARPVDLLTNNTSDVEQQLDSTRVEIEAALLGQTVDQSVCVLNLQDDRAQQVFRAYLPMAHPDDRLAIPLGSHLRLRGVFKAVRDRAPDIGQAVTSFEMYLNSPDDITVTARPNWWTAQHTLWLFASFAGVLTIVLAWVGLLRNQVRQRTRALQLKIGEHERSQALLAAEIVQRERAQADADRTHRDLLAAARQAGMAEVAIGVLHNVGNVLNSVNVSSSIVVDRLRQFKADRLTRAVGLLREHEDDLPEYLSKDVKGRQIIPYLEKFAGHLEAEQADVLQELNGLSKNIEHIKDIVAVQQNYATYAGLTEPLQVVELVEDALRMNASSLQRHDVRVVRDFHPRPPLVNADKHKILQILVNLIRNAKQSCDESGRSDKEVVIRVGNGNRSVKISTIDNGVGIPPENLGRIFNHGFTTRRDGHGFGLHNAAIAAQEMGGALCVFSSGAGKGATFTLELPLAAPCA